MEKHMKKAQKIKDMIQAGKTNAEIVKAVPTATLQQIYNHRYLMKKNKLTPNQILLAKKLGVSQEVYEVEVKKLKKRKEVAAAACRDAARAAIQIILDKPANAVQVGGEHYKTKGIQPWDAIHAWGLGFFSGNVVKYVARHREKNGVEDLKKARHYLDKLIEIMEAK